MEPLLVLALELVVEDDPLDAGIPFRQARLAHRKRGRLEVVFELALAFEASVERLAVLLVTASSGDVSP